MGSVRLLVIGDARGHRSLHVVAARHGVSVRPAGPHEDAVAAAQRVGPALILIGTAADRCDDALAAVRALRQAGTRTPIVLVAHTSSEAMAIAALKAGVSDYISSAAEEAAFETLFRQWLPAPSAPVTVDSHDQPVMVGGSRAMAEIRERVGTIAATDSNVLVTGETGTGKELVAQMLHAGSARRHGPFVSINCAALPDSLVESELFGAERGAFTGAGASRDGHLRAANGGTVLLDEIGEMSAYGQAKILRALDAREVSRLGSTKRFPLNIRVVSATNQDLLQLVDSNHFRKDLYYRLNVVRVRLPPLRERREDIAVIVSHYVAASNIRFHRSVQGFDAGGMQQLVEYDWPGNVREVRNVVESAFASLPNRPVTFLEMPTDLRDRLRLPAPATTSERERLAAALRATNWNKSRAAEQLHWSRMTLYRKLAKYDMQG